MLISLLALAVPLGWGLLAARIAGVTDRRLALGLSPAAGLACCTVLGFWAATLRLPALAVGIATLAVGALGLALGAHDVWRARRRLNTADRAHGALLLVSVLGPIALMAAALGPWPVPPSSHDGAHHVEMVTALRAARGLDHPYPFGLHAWWAALLAAAPDVDSARGSLLASLALPGLATLALAGLSLAARLSWTVAVAAAALAALTFHFPYYPHVWSGWPVAAGLVLVLGLWTTALRYLDQPSLRVALLAGLLAAATLLTHGPEVYSSILGMLAILVARRRQVSGFWRTLAGHLALAFALALALASAYLPMLLGWAARGGATAGAGLERASKVEAVRGTVLEEWSIWVDAGVLATNSLDVSIRLALLLGGSVWLLRRRQGRLLLALSWGFAALALGFTYVEHPLVDALIRLTFPWTLKYRLAFLPSILWNAVEAAALVAMLGALARVVRTSAQPTIPRLAPAVAAALLLLWAETSAVVLVRWLGGGSADSVAWSADDAAASDWLRRHAEPGAVVLNDGSADAGIWLPYTAGVQVTLPRLLPARPDLDGHLLRERVVSLRTDPAALAAACHGGVSYVYRGAKGTPVEQRQFPTLADLRRSPDLEEAFASGEAVVFRLRLECPPTHATQ